MHVALRANVSRVGPLADISGCGGVPGSNDQRRPKSIEYVADDLAVVNLGRLPPHSATGSLVERLKISAPIKQRVMKLRINYAHRRAPWRAPSSIRRSGDDSRLKRPTNPETKGEVPAEGGVPEAARRPAAILRRRIPNEMSGAASARRLHARWQV